MNDIFTKRQIKIGLLFGGIVVAFNLVLGIINTFIPVLVCITWVLYGLVWVVLFAGGYANGHTEGFTKETMANNLKKAIGAGLFAAIAVGILGGIITIILSLFPRTVSYLGYSYTYTDFTVLGAILGFIGSVVGALISSLFWFIVGGLAYAYYPASRLPANVSAMFDKVKAFAMK